MPRRSQAICAHPGCNTLSDSRYCQQHAAAQQQQRKQADKRRGSAASRGYGSQWRKARVVYLAEHPLCKHCKAQGLLTPATIIDHIKPHRGDMVLFWDQNNWQPLCKRHHDIKTASEDGGYGNG